MTTCNDESVRQFLDIEVGELGSCDLSGYLTDGRGRDLALADVHTVTLSLLDEVTEAVINGRDAQDILNTNGGTLSTEEVDGVAKARLDLVLSGDDHPIVNVDLETGDREVHVAILRWTFGPDNTDGVKELSFPVLALADVP